MKISIPKPCHESWSEMLPEEQGRFCLKCTKTVVDFSVKSKEEITSFLKEATGKVCGRFAPGQLYEKPKPFFSRLYPVQRIGKFALALYLVFGTMLFSCSDKSRTLGEPNVEHVKGDVVEIEQPRIGKVKLQDTTTQTSRETKKTCAPGTQTTQMVYGDTVIIQPEILKTGEVIIE
ncbi:MAG: hypothetical protein ACO1O6_08895 [Bacteroidota bacterium]